MTNVGIKSDVGKRIIRSLPTKMIKPEWREMMAFSDKVENFPSARLYPMHAISWNILVKSVSLAEYEVPRDQPINVLSAACGECEEGLVLNSFFGGEELGRPSEKVIVYGIDDTSYVEVGRYSVANCADDFEQNKIKYMTESRFEGNFKFIDANLLNIAEIPDLPKQFDVIMIRNYLLSQEATKATLNMLASGGLMLITFTGSTIRSFPHLQYELKQAGIKDVYADDTFSFVGSEYYDLMFVDTAVYVGKKI
ncbi:MAG: hypothetical protein PHH14_01070 [Candidatus Margulisbacteria bacterium]|nr:hypothetical protein [Candidatus Margulisiibacteriota bacterium]